MAEVAKELQKKEVETKEGIERTRTRKVYTPAVDVIEKKGEIVVVAACSARSRRVIRKPDSTKKRSTPQPPKLAILTTA